MFAGIAVGCAIAVVFHRNPVHCALFLIAVLLSISGLFILLSAAFIAALQVLVYAGAIMVLFLFVLMLLGAKGESPLLTRGVVEIFRHDWSLDGVPGRQALGHPDTTLEAGLDATLASLPDASRKRP